MKSVRELVIDQIKAEKEAEETGKPVAQPDAQGRLPMNEAKSDLRSGHFGPERMSFTIQLTVEADPGTFDIVSVEDALRQHLDDNGDVEKIINLKIKEILTPGAHRG